MGREAVERETVIVFNDEEGVTTIWTASPKVRNCLTLRGVDMVGTESWQGTVPKSFIKFGKLAAHKPKKKMSAEHKDKLRTALIKARAAKKSKDE